MTNADPAHFSTTDFNRAISDRPVPRTTLAQPFRLTSDMINGLVVIGGSLAMALAGIGLGAWLQLPFGN